MKDLVSATGNKLGVSEVPQACGVSYQSEWGLSASDWGREGSWPLGWERCVSPENSYGRGVVCVQCKRVLRGSGWSRMVGQQLAVGMGQASVPSPAWACAECAWTTPQRTAGCTAGMWEAADPGRAFSCVEGLCWYLGEPVRASIHMRGGGGW